MIETNIVPITSENCHLLTPLDLFYWSLEQIVIQGRRASNDGDQCCYRTQYEGQTLKCAAGWCITDDAYDHNMEGSGLYKVLSDSAEDFISGSSLSATTGYKTSPLRNYFRPKFTVEQIKAVVIAQAIHDTSNIEDLKKLTDERLFNDSHLRVIIAKADGFSFHRLSMATFDLHNEIKEHNKNVSNIG